MSSINVNTIKSRLGGPPTLPSGVVVSAAATFSTDVSIGGTLTYEDVTNVDAVGLITARNGIKFGVAGIGGTIRANGDTTLAGVVTATSFVGDITGDVTGDLTGTVNTAAQPSVTSLGTLTGLVVNGDTKFGLAGVGGTITAVGNAILSGITTIGTGLSFADNIEAKFGNSGDLRIYHDASNAFVAQSGPGDLYIQANTIGLRNGAGSATFFRGVTGAQADLYFNNTVRLTTNNTGVKVTDNLDVIGIATVGGGLTAYGGLSVEGTLVEAMSSTTTAYNTSNDLNISNGNFHFSSANLGGTGTTLNIMSTTGINTSVNINQVLNVTAVTAVNATTAFVNKITIDGKATGITTHWVGGSVPSAGGGSGVDTYSFNILKTGSETYIIVANQVKTS